MSPLEDPYYHILLLAAIELVDIDQYEHSVWRNENMEYLQNPHQPTNWARIDCRKINRLKINGQQTQGEHPSRMVIRSVEYSDWNHRTLKKLIVLDQLWLWFTLNDTKFSWFENLSHEDARSRCMSTISTNHIHRGNARSTAAWFVIWAIVRLPIHNSQTGWGDHQMPGRRYHASGCRHAFSWDDAQGETWPYPR